MTKTNCSSHCTATEVWVKPDLNRGMSEFLQNRFFLTYQAELGTWWQFGYEGEIWAR